MTTLTPDQNSQARRAWPRLPQFDPISKIGPISLPFQRSWVAISLAIITLIAAGLRVYNLQSVGNSNEYYTAAVKAMLQSFSNFFFAAAEPGGSVTVDKPPLGLWLQAISAMIFGVNGVAVVLPQVIAGILSVPLLFVLVRRYFGDKAGLIAGFVLAVTPVSIAVERNNTMDATLIFTLLLAAWAFIRATDTGKLKYLLLGGVLVGLGFNIKMMQAFLPLPAFYTLYFFGAKIGFRRKVRNLILATLLLLTVSFSWATVVQLTPADQRPYIGSSTNNNVFELIFGYNGLSRLIGVNMGGGPSGAAPATDGAGTAASGSTGSAQLPALTGAATDDGRGPGGPGGNGGAPMGFNIGQSGVLRLVTAPLANEVGWMLPFGLFAIGLLIFSKRIRFPLDENHQAAVLFGGWLLTATVFFSLANFFHPYYLAMLAPPLAALVGIGVMRLWVIYQGRTLRLGLLIAVIFGALAGYQIYTAAQYSTNLLWAIPMVGLFGTGVALIIRGRNVARLAAIGFICLFLTTLWTPTAWATMTTAYTNASAMLPEAYSGDKTSTQRFPGGMTGAPGMAISNTTGLQTYLLVNTSDVKYLVAVTSAGQGESFVLNTGRPVLYMGGFSGSDPVVDSTKLAQMVGNKQVRYVLLGGGGPMGTNQSLSQWVTANCKAVPSTDYAGSTAPITTSTETGSAAQPTGLLDGMLGMFMAPALYACGVS
jgi:4-amino-4-deoxy-L-arabinose transferase-like glycosyltransferase